MIVVKTGRPQEALLCAKAERQLQMFSVAKAERQQQSALPERKSTPRLRITSLPIALLIVTFYL
ncbi:hypothetical protein [Lysinibacillus sp. fls2-241-R2A-57]|uniref:hypothetical protein n=1 Tax=Lysinibacillus sp. fls2-241-R2A-57 TaxID=3040292 RepID=UPI002552A0C1|nr:hypothetical protein [Lysinibacillus sp. fls2-241-R2A-57]